MRAVVLEMPAVRRDLEHYLETLADRSRASWVEGQLDYIVHFFFDDSEFATDAIGYVGIALHSEAEANAVAGVVAELDALLQRNEADASTTELVSDAGWPAVVQAAASALAELRSSSFPPRVRG